MFLILNLFKKIISLLKSIFEHLLKFFKWILKNSLLLINIITLILLISLYIHLEKYQIENKYEFFNIKLNVTYLLVGCITFNVITICFSNLKWLNILNIANLSWGDFLKYFYSGNEVIYTKLAIFRRIRTIEEKYGKLVELLQADNIELPSQIKEKLIMKCLNFYDLQQQYLIEKKIYLETKSELFEMYEVLVEFLKYAACIGYMGLVVVAFGMTVYSWYKNATATNDVQTLREYLAEVDIHMESAEHELALMGFPNDPHEWQELMGELMEDVMDDVD